MYISILEKNILEVAIILKKFYPPFLIYLNTMNNFYIEKNMQINKLIFLTMFYLEEREKYSGFDLESHIV